MSYHLTHPSEGAANPAPLFSATLSPLDMLAMRVGVERIDPVAEYDRLREEEFAAARDNMMRAMRIQCERTIEQRKRADFLEQQLASARCPAWALLVAAGFIVENVYLWVTR